MTTTEGTEDTEKDLEYPLIGQLRPPLGSERDGLKYKPRSPGLVDH